MAAQPTNLDELLRTPALSNYDNVLDTCLTNKRNGQGFYMDNIEIMYVKALTYVFSEYNKKDRTNASIFSAIKIQ